MAVKLLALFHERKGEVLDRNVIFNHGWGMDHYPNTRTLDQHIAQLRKRIERDPKSPELIQTVHGAGYRYDIEHVKEISSQHGRLVATRASRPCRSTLRVGRTRDARAAPQAL